MDRTAAPRIERREQNVPPSTPCYRRHTYSRSLVLFGFTVVERRVLNGILTTFSTDELLDQLLIIHVGPAIRSRGCAAPETFISDATTGRATEARDDAPP